MKYLLFWIVVLSADALSDDSEVVAARKGAPGHISDNASIMVWENGVYTKKIKGSNEFTCFVSADKQGTFEPSCLNEAARRSILPVYQFQRRMLERQMNINDIHSEIEKGAKNGRFLKPEPGAVVYMTYEENKYYNHFERQLIHVKPHIMLYYPKLKASSLGFNAQGGLPSFYSDFPHLSVVHIHTDTDLEM